MAEKVNVVDKERWNPKTELGRMVKNGEITTLEQISDTGKPILESEIADVLLQSMESETLLIKSTQRVTDSGRKIQFRVVVVVGDHNGHVGIGVGKSEEIRPALDYAVRDAKKNMISLKMGCGSWECKCNVPHSVPKATTGKEGSTTVNLKPAPRGLGIASNATIKKVLNIAGVKDVWSTSTGNTKNVYNTAMATIKALENIAMVKPHPVRGQAQ
ncbi:30S ribosomal protein S5 [uncultured archaeon]|nr:30S ribosomal protein S5 [uncultured archaeon]